MGAIFCKICNRAHDEPWLCPKCGFCLVKFGIDEGLKDLMEHTRCGHCGHMILTNVSSPAMPDPEEQDPLAFERTFDEEWGTEDEENDFPLDEVDR